jgi:putative transposase
MIRSHRIKLNPSSAQRQYFAKAAGTRRFVYNWGLAEWKHQYETGEQPSANKFKTQFNAIKRELFPWVYAVTKCAAEGAFMDLGKAFESFFSGKTGYPRFKRKHDREESFYIDNDKFKVKGFFCWIPRLGWVNMTEELRFEGKILSARFKQDKVGDWYVSISVEVPSQPQTPVGEAVGVDSGILRLATLSDGGWFENPKPLAIEELRLTRLQRSLSRKQKGSKRWEKTRIRLAKVHRRVQHVRWDAVHKATTQLVQNYRFIGVEDLHVQGMMHNQHLAKFLGDAALGLLRDLLLSKALRYGVTVQQVSRFFPSSKLCSQCGHLRDELSLADRVYMCSNPACQVMMDRDLNAALNIRQEALRLAQAARPS